MGKAIRFLAVLAPLALFGSAVGPAAVTAASDAPAYREVIVVRAAPALPLSLGEERYAKIVDAAARAYGVDAALVHAVILAESSYDASAVSAAGASGLMQLMPDTAQRLGVHDVFDPADNVRGGVRHLKLLLELFDGDVELAVAAYNAGENAVIRAGHRIPPNPQTASYVPKVIGYYRGLQVRRE
jgi:soluble lytic murein transglycosylase-like protein